jgi:hypothetical protein
MDPPGGIDALMFQHLAHLLGGLNLAVTLLLKKGWPLLPSSIAGEHEYCGNLFPYSKLGGPEQKSIKKA